ncbi:hypothetical protein EP073_02460 [Geovibrio thiophilus]|uniref:Uncharacterized protein n=1 Tax=Geovibrio thiophilus TaxID=139438 RepID=A0A3R5UZV6_9BACT|nr:hypothetical protein [Geovibrio thiophilus]QAR32299.1 hypothetical protein EP073_02460 [Geovibrio thiophilus]
MKEKALELKKEFTRMKDDWEELTEGEKLVARDRETEYERLTENMSEADLKWIENGFAAWYSEYIDVETKIFIKPCEG